ncbi:MAG TPA: NAD(P)H:quinone oxidoreductase [Nitriliruptoraceae bacterium]|nr:NAD(P)H:quinone oxidoreductase [Nitriliruptoraceae bacterium]
MASIGIVYFSMYGSTHDLVSEVATGVTDDGGQAHLRRLPHGLPDDVASDDAVQAAQQAQEDVAFAEVDELAEFDGIVFGSGTRFGSASSQLQGFFDQCGPLWAEGTLVDVPAGFVTSASTMHGGHETTIMSMSTFAFHLGMPIVPMGYTHDATGETRSGGGPYGPSLLMPQDGDKEEPTHQEAAIARAYGARMHRIAQKLAA